MSKRGLIIVTGGNSFLFAAQIKHTLYKNIPIDMVYYDVDIDEGAARELFDGVYKCKPNVAPLRRDAINCFLNPQYAIRKYYVDVDVKLYTDIFFWIPSWLHYFLYKFSCYSGHKYHWHLYPEGAGAYLYVYPSVGVKRYGYKWIANIIEKIDEMHYRYLEKSTDIIEDVYLINSESAVTDETIKKINIPPFDIEDKEYIGLINRIVRYEEVSLENKIIFLDGSLDRVRADYYNVDIIDDLLVTISKKIGKDNLILKRKHHVGKEQYSSKVKNAVTFYNQPDMPWELVCLNDGIKNCVLLSVPSSVLVLPYIFCNYSKPTYMLGNNMAKYSLNEEWYSRAESFYKRVTHDDMNYNVLNSIDELKNSYDYICGTNK